MRHLADFISFTESLCTSQAGQPALSRITEWLLWVSALFCFNLRLRLTDRSPITDLVSLHWFSKAARTEKNTKTKLQRFSWPPRKRKWGNDYITWAGDEKLTWSAEVVLWDLLLVRCIHLVIFGLVLIQIEALWRKGNIASIISWEQLSLRGSGNMKMSAIGSCDLPDPNNIHTF